MLTYTIGNVLLGLVFNTTFNKFQWGARVSFIGGGKRSAQRKPWTCHKSLANFIT